MGSSIFKGYKTLLFKSFENPPQNSTEYKTRSFLKLRKKSKSDHKKFNTFLEIIRQLYFKTKKFTFIYVE